LVDPAEINPILRMRVNACYQPELETIEFFIQLEFRGFSQNYRKRTATIIAKSVIKLRNVRDPLGASDVTTENGGALTPSRASGLQFRKRLVK